MTDGRGLDLRSWAQSLLASRRIIIACIVGFLVSWLFFWYAVPSWNAAGAVALYDLVSGNVAVFAIGTIATIGDDVWIPLVFYLYVFRKKQYDWTSSLTIAIAMVTTTSLVTVLKLLFGLPRPFQVSSLGLTARFETPTDHGLPSGHTTTAFTLATVIWSRYSQWRIPATGLALATGICMIILGLHFPSDVFAGTFLGIFCGTFATTMSNLRAHENTQTQA